LEVAKVRAVVLDSRLVPQRLRWILLATIVVSACGSPTGPPPPPPTLSVSVVAYYDENGNGVLDGNELVRFPGATVKAGTSSGHTDAGGHASFSVAQGQNTFILDEGSLPPFFHAVPTNASVPASGVVNVAATLPIGGNHVNTYMAFGDSITADLGYPEELVARLQQYFGAAYVNNEGEGGTRSGEGLDNGAARINSTLRQLQPAYTLILYGTNDWNVRSCQSSFPCFTIQSLQYMVMGAKGAQSLPFLATIPPVNVGYGSGATPERQAWVHRMDDLVRSLARDEGAVLVDLEKAFLAEPDQPSLFNDHIHPSPKGVGIMVNEFFKAITQRQAQSSSQRTIFSRW
jgi:lysophospholipase L1-like esterase